MYFQKCIYLKCIACLLSFASLFKVTPLGKRIYSESSDQEMDIWLQVPKRVNSSLKSQDPLLPPIITQKLTLLIKTYF